MLGHQEPGGTAPGESTNAAFISAWSLAAAGRSAFPHRIGHGREHDRDLVPLAVRTQSAGGPGPAMVTSTSPRTSSAATGT